jgi:tetratricopeptide (TPR) repeat protein
MSTLTGRPTAARRWKWLALAALTGLILAGLYPLSRYLWTDSKYQAALAAAERRDFVAARADFDRCMREWPESAEVRFQASRCERRAGDFQAAGNLLREAKRLGWVSEAIELESVLAAVQQGQHRPYAAALLELVRRGHPDSVLILEALTPAALTDLEMDIAAECLELWLERAPRDERPRLLKGELLERARNRNDAMALYREALRLAPESAEARLKCGRLALEQKSDAEAAEHFEWLMKHKPTDRAVRRGMAQVRQAQARPDEARAILDDLLAENADDPEALAARGQLEIDAGNAKLAEKWLKPAAAGSPSELHILYQWARCLDLQGRTQEADEVRTRMQRGEEDQKKVAELMRELVKRPHDPEIRLKIGQLMMRNGLDADGRRWLFSALSQDPMHIPTHQALVDYYERAGNRERAEEHRRILREVENSKKTPEGR